MKNSARHFIATIGIGLSLVIATPRAFADPLGEMTAEWWQWALSIPTSENPVVDTTGEKCMVGQRGLVWFLAGAFSDAPIHRECEVPQGTWLFFPVVNQALFDSPNKCGQDANSLSVKEMRALVDGVIDGIKKAEVRVDGKRIRNIDRVQSVVFSVALPAEADNVMTTEFNAPCRAGIYSPTVDDGLYVLLPPLAAGKSHTLQIYAENRDRKVIQDVTYDLVVVPVKQR